MTRILCLAIAAGILLSPMAGHAREPGDPQKGRVLAERTCMSCHAIGRQQLRSPNPDAPAFRQLARTPGMTATALRAGLQTSHRNMPNLVLHEQDREDIIAYILALNAFPQRQL